MNRFILIRAFMGLIGACGIGFAGFGQNLPDSVESVVEARLLKGWRADDGTYMAGLEINLAEGWRTYWRSPGDGGIPTQISWQGSVNLERAELLWPRPVVFRTSGFRSVGYVGRVVLPVRMTAKHDKTIYPLIELNLGVCKEICVPVSITIEGELAQDGIFNAQSISSALAIKTALAAQPKVIGVPLKCELEREEDAYHLTVATKLTPLSGTGETAVIELSDPAIWVSEPSFLRHGNQVNASVRLIKQTGASAIDLSSLRMTVLTSEAAVEINGCD